MSSTEPDVRTRIARLFVYPVKSCAGIEVTEAPLTETGLDLDRAWMVVDEEGEFVSQRDVPRMALIKPQLKHSDVVLRAPGMLALHLALDQVERPARVRVWNDEVEAWDMGDVAAQWFSDFLGRKLRVARFDPHGNGNKIALTAGEREFYCNIGPDAHYFLQHPAGGQPNNKKPWRPKGVQGRNVFEQTDSPLALFFVVAISWADN